MPSLSSASAAARIVSQSEVEPMMMPTSGFITKYSSNKVRIERNSSRDAPRCCPRSTRSLVALVMSACSALRSARGTPFEQVIERRRTFGEQPRCARLRCACAFRRPCAVARDSALSAASMGAGSMSRMSLPMYCRWRASPPAAGDALREQDGVVQGFRQIRAPQARIP